MLNKIKFTHNLKTEMQMLLRCWSISNADHFFEFCLWLSNLCEMRLNKVGSRLSTGKKRSRTRDHANIEFT